MKLECIPVIPTIDIVVFPGMVVPLLIVDQRIIKGVLSQNEKDNKYIVLVACKKQSSSMDVSISAQDLYAQGTLCSIIRVINLHDNTIKVLVQGISKVDVIDLFIDSSLFANLQIYSLDFFNLEHSSVKFNTFKNYIEKMPSQNSLYRDFSLLNHKNIDLEKLLDMVVSHLNLSLADNQKLLEQKDVNIFFDLVLEFLLREIEVISLQEKIKNKAKKSLDSIHREFYVREQIKALKEEIGEGVNDDISSYVEKLKKIKLSSEYSKEIEKSIDRLDSISKDSSEYSILKSYLDLFFELPWNIKSMDMVNLVHAKKILDEDHFGLFSVKNRILDFLSVRTLSEEKHGIILCFYGPPGTGKTSLAQSIAKALGRQSFKISVGGLKDESEIRGHRRTYVGAMPGRIIKGIKQVQVKNPLIIIDEIDKMGQDSRMGDPASALLEVLDYQQNNAFYDHYLSIPFDLSECIFIATANKIENIHYALRDRMEFIELSSYTFQEKKYIAGKHLVDKALKECGLDNRGVLFPDAVLETIISDYTHEAGVRDLERSIKKICSRIARFFVEENSIPILSVDNLEKFLGVKKFISQVEEIQEHRIGVSRGLAWTSCGGETFHIEAVLIPGNGKIIMTGQLGDVMKESAQAALSYIKSNQIRFKIQDSVFNSQDIHLHIPAGAIPKDGPSAGAAILTALLSCFTQRPLMGHCAMTGEIDLQGHVLPVGGIKEKVLAAKKNNINRIILPKKNEGDIFEIKEYVENLELIFVSHINDVLDCVFSQDNTGENIQTS